MTACGASRRVPQPSRHTQGVPQGRKEDAAGSLPNPSRIRASFPFPVHALIERLPSGSPARAPRRDGGVAAAGWRTR
eukprot:350868-Chlamydomonas_euryale.AAC.9